MNCRIPASGRPGESLEQLLGSVFDLAGQFAAQISQDDIEARLRRAVQVAQRPAAAPGASQPLSVLASMAAGGDREAWDQIIDRYAPLVWSICARYQLDRQDIDDIGQRIWRQLARNIRTLRNPAALPGWLATMTHRECRLLRARRRDHPELPAVGQIPAGPAGPAIGQEILAAERDAALRAAFAQLPSSCRELLSMLLSDPPYSDAEISAALGIAAGSIGPERARCLDHLRQAIIDAPSGREPGQHYAEPGLQ